MEMKKSLILHKKIYKIPYKGDFQKHFMITMSNNPFSAKIHGRIRGKDFYIKRNTDFFLKNSGKTVLYGSFSDREIIYWFGKEKTFILSILLYYTILFIIFLISIVGIIKEGLMIENRDILFFSGLLIFFILGIVPLVTHSNKEENELIKVLLRICDDEE